MYFLILGFISTLLLYVISYLPATRYHPMVVDLLGFTAWMNGTMVTSFGITVRMGFLQLFTALVLLVRHVIYPR
jgi:hypothetical protein